MQGRTQYLWRAVDEDGDVIDILVQPRRNRRAAIRFFHKLLNTQGALPRCLITDKLPSYQAACRTLIPSVLHGTAPYANNRVEVSHQPTCTAPGFLDTHLCYAAWRSSYSSRASIGV